jgi:DNA repair protein RecN (Recombination protein N)
MLVSLSIRDFVIVDALELELDAGFTALTGETGAGKSILLDALGLALGDRADADVVRAGAERAEIQATFDIRAVRGLADWLAEQALEGDGDELLLRRVIDRGGRSRGFVNGRQATLAQMREAGERMVDIHGQHAHQSLVKADAQRSLLDAHAGLVARVEAVGAAWREWQRLARERAEYAADAAARDAEREQLRWQVDELKRLALRPDEWAEVQNEQSRLGHAASLVEGAQAALEAVSEGEGAATAAVSAALSRLNALTQYDASLGPIVELLHSATAQLQEAGYSLRHYRDRVDLDPARLREVEARLDDILATARKFRVRPEALGELAERLGARVAALEVSASPEALERAETAAREQYAALAGALTRDRKKAAAKLAKEVAAEMKDLALGIAKFDVALVPIEGGSATGDERVELLVATNAGTEPRPLARVASGGELSRISLAIQVITSKAAAVPTLIFDEVDAGIGGAVAEIVGRKLRALGESRQVLCVTHLPQVAARAMHQWSVAKVDAKGITRSRVTRLADAGRIEEIARMLGGTEITATTRRHAAEMLGLKAGRA